MHHLIFWLFQASFTQKDVTTSDGTVARFKIWDTAGQEKFRGLTPMYFRGAEGSLSLNDYCETLLTLSAWSFFSGSPGI